MPLDDIYTLRQVAESMGVSSRFLRDYVNGNKVEHLRVGNGTNARIKFTTEQVAGLRAMFVQQPVPQSITTGRRRKAG